MTNEFAHYDGCRHKDPDNCSGCALTQGGPEGPNYAAWPLVYMVNHRSIPGRWFDAFLGELASENRAYANNIRAHMAHYGVCFIAIHGTPKP
jgi:hypothetical protein